MRHVTIIGGGIAGLATAFHLQQLSEKHKLELSYTLLESNDRLGGKIVTDTAEGYTIEGGPDSFITQKPWGLQLCEELGISNQLIPSNDGRGTVHILKDDKLLPMPDGYRLAVPTKWGPFLRSPLLSVKGKLRVAMDLFVKPRKVRGDESLADFMRRRIGDEALENLAGPLMAGIYSADPEKMSIDSTFPMFVEMERKHGSIVRAMMKAKRQRSGIRGQKSEVGGQKPQAIFNSLRTGMGTLVATIESQLTGDLRTGVRATRIEKTDKGLAIVTEGGSSETLVTDAIVLAVPAYTAASMIEKFHRSYASMLKQIRYGSSATVSLGFRTSDMPDAPAFRGFGVVIPRRLQKDVMAFTCSSNKFDHRSPGDGALVRVFLGGPHAEEVVERTDEAMIDAARETLKRHGGLAVDPVVARVFRWPVGNPQYDVGHLDHVGKLEKISQAIPGVHLAGSAYRGIGIPDCVHSGQVAAERVVKYLAAKTLEA